MANGTIAFDTLQTSDSANTGTSKTIDTSFLFNGSAKVWVNFNGTSTGAAAGDSFNLTSMTDNGTGDYTLTFALDMVNALYSATATGYKPSASHGFITNNNGNFFASDTLRIETVEDDGGHKQTEFTQSCVTIHGDLA